MLDRGHAVCVALALHHICSAPCRISKQVRAFGQRACHLTQRSKPTPDSMPSLSITAYNNDVPSVTARRGRVSPQR